MMTVGAELYASLIEWYRIKTIEHDKMDPQQLAQTMAVALNQYAAVVSVDLGMDKSRYLKVCSLLFDNAYQKAPKFG